MISNCVKCVSAPGAAVCSIALALSMTREEAEMCPKADNGAYNGCKITKYSADSYHISCLFLFLCNILTVFGHQRGLKDRLRKVKRAL